MKEDCQATGILQVGNESMKHMLQTCYPEGKERMPLRASQMLAEMMGSPWANKDWGQWWVQRAEHQATGSILMP